MAFTDVSSLDADVTVALGKKDKTGKPYPKQAEGYYLGSRTVQNKRGDSQLHFLQTAKGNLGIWGTTDLNRKLSQVTVGTMVNITSTGTKPTPNGDMYTYRVQQDKNNTIEVGDAGGDTAGYVDSNESHDDAYDDGGDEDDNQNAALQAAERAARQAKVQEVLNRGRK